MLQHGVEYELQLNDNQINHEVKGNSGYVSLVHDLQNENINNTFVQ
jgi:hypothetical protein